MAPPYWTHEHAAKLKALRERAGWDVSALARRHNLSVSQVRQLEDGGEQAFYTPQIKLAVGRKLILALGGEFADPPEERVAAPTVPVPADGTSSDQETGSAKNPQSIHATSLKAGAITSVSQPLTPVKLGSSRWFVGSLAVALVLGLVWFIQQPPPFARSNLIEAKDPLTVRSPSVKAPQTDSPEPASTALPPATPVPPTPSTPSIAEPVQAGDECLWASSAPDLTPESSARPDNYVHVVAHEHSLVCWRDADHKVRKQRFESGEALSFWGRPPFEVYASAPAALKIYFKGQAVHWPGTTEVTHIVLGSRHKAE